MFLARYTSNMTGRAETQAMGTASPRRAMEVRSCVVEGERKDRRGMGPTQTYTAGRLAHEASIILQGPNLSMSIPISGDEMQRTAVLTS